MKKAVFGLVAGLVLGTLATWLMFPRESATTVEANDDEATVAEVEAIASGRVHFSKEEQGTAGLIMAAPKEGGLNPEMEAFGRVLDPASLIALVAEVEAARATLDASEKNLARTEKLHAADRNASAQALEAAQAAVARDRAQFAAARAQLVATWGPALAGRGDRVDFQLALANGTSALVRIDLPAGEIPTRRPAEVRAQLIGDAEMHLVEIVGPAPMVDPQVQGVAYLGIWKKDPPAIGITLRALVPTGREPQRAWLVPRSALVRHQGSLFVYVQTTDEIFTRRRVVPAEPQEKGVPVTEGLNGDERIVVTGAQQLLSTELDAGGEPD